MSIDFRTIIDFVCATGGQVQINHRDMGHIVQKFKGSGFIGGSLSQVFTDNLGRLQTLNINISSILGCGHHIVNPMQISGYCQVCGRLCCKKIGCLRTCEFLGITVCNRHYVIKNGVVVSTRGQKGLWRLKTRRIEHKRREIADAKKQLPEKF